MEHKQRIFWGAVLVFSFISGSLFGLSGETFAASGSPKIISYQGRLTDASGTLLGSSSGTVYYFKFSIWDNATVGSGTRLWPTSAPGVATTTVKQGVANFNIGDTANGYPDALTYDFNSNADVYLQVEVSSDGITYETLSPRQRIDASGFAINSNTVGGLIPGWGSTGGFVSLATSTDQVGIGATSSLAKLFVQSTGAATVTEILQGAAGQTADLFRAASSSGVIYFQISNLGVASSSEFRTPSSTITTLNFTNASGTNLTASGYLQAQNIFDLNGNRYSTSTGGGGTGGITTSTPVFAGGIPFFLENNASSVVITSSGLNFVSSTGVFTVLNVSTTNINASGYGTFPTLNFTNASGTNLGLTGYIYSANVSSSNVSSTNIGNGGYHYNLGNLGVGTTTTSNLVFVATSSPIFVVSSTGLVGIGVSAPNTALQVSGSHISNIGVANFTGSTYGYISIDSANTYESGIYLKHNGSVKWYLLDSPGSSVYSFNIADNNKNPRITVLQSGLVGLGTSTPSSLLHLANTLTLVSSSVSSTLQVTPILAGSFGSAGPATYYNSYGVPVVGFTTATTTISNFYGNYIGLTNNTSTITNWYGNYVAAPTGAGTITNNYAFVSETNAGNVGIGTSSPASLFTIATSTNIFNVSSTGVVMVATTSNPFTAGLFAVATSSPIFGINQSGQMMVGTTTASGLFTIAGSSPILVVSSTGNVGIGTANPGYTLDIRGQSGNDARVRLNGSDYNGGPTLIFNPGANEGGIISMSVSGRNLVITKSDASAVMTFVESNGNVLVNQGSLGIGNVSPSGIFVVSSSIIFASSTTGNVGIGTSTPSSLFTVATSSNIFNVNNSGQVMIGTSTASGIFSVATSTPIFVISNTGNDGIGTSSPASLLHLANTLTLASSSASSTFQITPTLAGSFGSLGPATYYGSYEVPVVTFTTATTTISNFYGNYIGLTNNTSTITNWYGNYVAAPTGGGTTTNKYAFVSEAGAGNIGVGTSSPVSLFTIATSTNIFNVSSSGFVSIGTSTPSQFFTIATSTNAFTVDLSGNVSSSANLTVSGYGKFPTLSFTNASGTNLGLTGYLYSANVSSSNVSSTNIGNGGYHYNLGNLGVGTTTTSNLVFVATSSPIFVVSSTGQVMISTTTASGLLYIATSSPIFNVLGGGVSVATTTNAGLFYVATSTSIFAVSNSGQVMIATTTVTAAATGTVLFNIATSTNIFTVLDNGFVGVGTSTPAYNIHVLGNIKVDSQGTGQSVLNDVQLGGAVFDTDLGQVTWMDMPVSANAATGTIESYTAQIGGTPVLTVYGESNGGGGTQNQRIGLGTSTPSSLLHLANTLTLVSSSVSSTLQVTPILAGSFGSAGPATYYNSYGVPVVGFTTATTTISNFYGNYIGLTNNTSTITNWYGNYVAAPTGAGTITNNYAFVSEAGAGNIGVGTSSPVSLFTIATSTNIFNVSSTGQIMIATTSNPFTAGLFAIATSSPIFGVNNRGQIAVNTSTFAGAINSQGGVTLGGLATGAGNGAVCMTTAGLMSYNNGANCIVSSLRFKNTVAPLDSGLSEILQLNPVSFYYNKDAGNTADKQVGLIAEEVMKIDPRLVVLDKDGLPYSVRYENLTAVLVKSIQDQQKEIDDLRGKLNPANLPAGQANTAISLASLDALAQNGVLTIDGDVDFYGHLYVSGDTAGTVTMPAGRNSVGVTFERPYKNPPVVTVSLASTDPAVMNWTEIRYHVASTTGQGFVVEIQPAVIGPVNFNWHALGTASSTASQTPIANQAPSGGNHPTSAGGLPAQAGQPSSSAPTSTNPSSPTSTNSSSSIHESSTSTPGQTSTSTPAQIPVSTSTSPVSAPVSVPTSTVKLTTSTSTVVSTSSVPISAPVSTTTPTLAPASSTSSAASSSPSASASPAP